MDKVWQCECWTPASGMIHFTLHKSQEGAKALAISEMRADGFAGDLQWDSAVVGKPDADADYQRLSYTNIDGQWVPSGWRVCTRELLP